MEDLAKKIRRKILTASFSTKACHIGSALSCVEILIALYFKVMKPDDKFIFSKASGVSALYSVLAEKGIIEERKVATYLKKYPLPSREVPGIDFSFGSLGMGLSVATGVALAKKLKGEKGKVFCLLSDGELQEGNTWEAVLFAGHHKLDNLVVIVDYNQIQACDRIHKVLRLEPLENKFSAFSWRVGTINGHNFKALEPIKDIPKSDKPTCIIAHTIKGRGVSFMEDKISWHYLNLTKSLLAKALKENA